MMILYIQSIVFVLKWKAFITVDWTYFTILLRNFVKEKFGNEDIREAEKILQCLENDIDLLKASGGLPSNLPLTLALDLSAHHLFEG